MDTGATGSSMSARQRLDELADAWAAIGDRPKEEGDEHAQGYDAGQRQAGIDLRALLLDLPREEWHLAPLHTDHIAQLARMADVDGVQVLIDNTGALIFEATGCGATQRIEPVREVDANG
jgi:hypothetical protein